MASLMLKLVNVEERKRKNSIMDKEFKSISNLAFRTPLGWYL
mgnify:CR=1 FL=1